MATEDLSPFDHKGRSRPIYERRSAEGPYRIGRWTRLFVGAWPGLRVLAQGQLGPGAWYASLGALLMGHAVLLSSNWHLLAQSAQTYGAREQIMLAPALLLWASVLAFEALRWSTAQVRPSVRWARGLSSLLLPAIAWCVTAPGLASLAPRWVEASIFAAGVLALAAVPATFACVVEVVMAPSPRRQQWSRRAYWGMAVLACSGCVALAAVPLPSVAARVDGLGLSVLALILR